MECIQNARNAQWNAFKMREMHNGMHSKCEKCTMECIQNARNAQWNAFKMREMHNGMHSKCEKCTMECIQNEKVSNARKQTEFEIYSYIFSHHKPGLLLYDTRLRLSPIKRVHNVIAHT